MIPGNHRTQPNSFVIRFIEESGGLSAVIEALSSVEDVEATSVEAVHTALLGCLKALMNHSVRITLSLSLP